MTSVDAPAERRDLRRMLRTTLRWRCPSCGVGRMFAGGYRLVETCRVCAVRFERNDGAGSGAAWIAQMLGTALGFAFGGLVWWRWGIVPGMEWWIAGGACVGILATYRFCQAWWFWLLWATGNVFPDPDDLTLRREHRRVLEAGRRAHAQWPAELRRVS